MQLAIPRDRMVKFCREKGYGHYENNDYTHKTALMNASDVEILLQYNAELRGIANYYSLAKKREGNGWQDSFIWGSTACIKPLLINTKPAQPK